MFAVGSTGYGGYLKLIRFHLETKSSHKAVGGDPPDYATNGNELRNETKQPPFLVQMEGNKAGIGDLPCFVHQLWKLHFTFRSRLRNE